MDAGLVEEWLAKTLRAERAVLQILAEDGHGPARVKFLTELRDKLSGAPVDVQEYFEEAILCLRHGLIRSSIVLAWSGFFSVFCDSLIQKKESEVRALRSKWVFTDASDFKEQFPESQIIDVAKEVAYISNPKRRMLDGWLSQRNQCAHPTVYRPSLNVGIGYIDSMITETLHFV